MQDGEAILPTFIPEEAEKQFTEPSWKLDLVGRMLKYMMGSDDKEITDSSDE